MEPIDEQTMRDTVAGIEKRVEKEGWLVIGVPGEGVEHSLSYTVGLTKMGLPEILVSGLPVQVAQVILNHLAHLSIFNGRFENGQRVTDVANMPVVILDCVLPAPANMVFQVYGTADSIQIQQMIYPDEQERFPWDEGYHMEPDPPVYGVLP